MGKPSLFSLQPVKDRIRQFMIEVGILKAPTENEGGDPYTGLINSFLSKLAIHPVINSRLVNVSFEGYSPKQITLIANTLAEMYILKNIELRSNIEKGASHWLQKRVGELRNKVKESELKLQKFKVGKNFIELKEKMNMATKKLGDINQLVTKESTERVRLETLKKLFKEMKSDPIDLFESLPDSLKSDVFRQLNKDYVALKSEYQEKSKKFGPKHPEMVSLSQKLKLIEKRIPTEIDRLIKTIGINFKTTIAQEKSLENSLEKQRQVVMDLEKASIQYNILKSELDSNKKLYEILINRLKEVNVSSGSNESNIRMVYPAEIPQSPIKPNKKQNLIFGLFEIGRAHV